MASNDRVAFVGGLEGFGRKRRVPIEVPLGHFSGGSRENHGRPQSGW
jgi:hypothetical protein